MVKKQQVEDMAEMVKGKVIAQVDKTKVLAEKEIAKVKKQLESTYATVESYAKKNPEKAAIVVAGVGAALGAALALLMTGGKKGKKK
jgi:ABC-type sugar transport system substrate-binding protein